MPAKFAGGCACGAIRYEVSADPIVMFNCHCRDCQRTTGGPYTPVFYVPAKAFKITKGSPKYYDTASEMVGENSVDFVQSAGRGYSAERLSKDRASRLRASMIQVCTSRNSKFGCPTRSRGTTWTRSCQNLRSISHQAVDG